MPPLPPKLAKMLSLCRSSSDAGHQLTVISLVKFLVKCLVFLVKFLVKFLVEYDTEWNAISEELGIARFMYAIRIGSCWHAVVVRACIRSLSRHRWHLLRCALQFTAAAVSSLRAAEAASFPHGTHAAALTVLSTPPHSNSSIISASHQAQHHLAHRSCIA